jgi:hypothetical protein
VVQVWCKIQKKNRKSSKIKDLRFASVLKTTCFRINLWKIQAGFIALGSIFLRLMTNAHQCH